MKKLLIFLTLIVCVVSLPSCKKFIEVGPSPNLIEADDVFSGDRTALSAVGGVYILMRSPSPTFANGTLSIYGSLSADEILNTAANTNYDAFYTNSLLSNNTIVNTQLWAKAYTTIYRCNAILEGLDKSNTLSDSVKLQLEGEMKLVRAFHYFYLVNLFGDVPLILTTSYQVNAIMPRTPVADIYVQVIKDLKEAQLLLKQNYPASGRLRPNQYTATALLARVYLYVKEYVKSEEEASKVISATGFYNLTAITGTFLKGNNETIWELTSSNEASNTTEGGQFVPASATTIPTFALTANLINAFEPGDKRRLNWIDSNKIGTPAVIYYYPKKYKARVTSTPLAEYEIILRLAEQYLIRSEARAQQNNITGAQADLNIIRSRASLPPVTANTQPELLTAVEKERRTELFTEFGHRWLDLKRTNRVDPVLSIIKGVNWQSTDALYPVPFNEIQYNPFLTQNPGYQ